MFTFVIETNISMEERIKALEERFKSVELLVGSLRETILTMSKHSVQSFNTIDQNFDIFNENFEGVNTKLDKLVKDAADGFETVGGQLDGLHEEVKKIQKVSNYSEEYENLLKISK